MSSKVQSRLAVSVWGLTMAAVVAAIALAAVNGFPLGFDPWGVITAGAITIGSLGGLVASKRPENPIGWLMLLTSLLDGLAAVGLQYGYLAEFGGHDLWGAEYLATVPYGVAAGAVFGITITLLLLLFPNGRLPSPRWRPVAVAAAIGVVAMAAGLAMFVVDLGLAGLYGQLADGMLDANAAAGLARILNEGGHVLVFIAFPLSVISLFIRRRRSSPVERQQLRWFAYGSVVFFFSVFIPLPGDYGLWFEVAATTFLFAAIGIAILRYRLYDIDRLVSRTVSYVVVTGMLVALYLGAVFVFQLVLPTESDLAVAASTLAVAAAFNPVRRRVQGFVDRRFNRSRYDAGRTVDTFSRRLRGATDAADLADQLCDTTAAVMEPAHLSLWLRRQT